jgi:hypothetical protein
MLHMVHVWARQESLKVELNYAKVAADGGLAAYKAIDNGSELDLRPKNSILTSGKSVRTRKVYKLKDLVESFWVQVCARKTVEALDRQKDGHILRLKSQRLCGWEFMDIVNGKSGRRKELKSCEDWLLLTEDVLVLFGQNFGSLIRPPSEISVCGAWNPIPCQQDYLTASMSSLQQFSKERGSQGSCTRLANSTYWVPRADPFRDCQECFGQDTNVRCRKVPQRLSSKKPSDKNHASPPADGAVTFGKCSGEMQKLRFPCFRIRATAEHTGSVPQAALPDRPQQGRQIDNTNSTSHTPSSRPKVPSSVSNTSRVGPVVLPPSRRPPGEQRWQISTRLDT